MIVLVVAQKHGSVSRGSCLYFWEAASAQGGRRAILILCTYCDDDNNSHNNSQHKVNDSHPEPNGGKPVYLCFAALLLCIHINRV